MKLTNLQVEADAQLNWPSPANMADYLRLIQSQFSYSDRAADGIPMKLDTKTKRAMLVMENLVADPPPSLSPFFLVPPRSLSLYLLAIYRNEVYFMYPFFNMHRFMTSFRKLFLLATASSLPPAHLGLGCLKEADPTTPLFQCALFMMLSHAVYFANLERNDKAFVSRIFWKCAQSFITLDLLKASNLAAVQTFLIIAVAFNSSLLPGVESKIPAELAYRIARSLGIDSENDQSTTDTTGQVQDIHRHAWYGCVMMNL